MLGICFDVAQMMTTRSGSGRGKGRSRTEFTTVNTAVLAPIPSTRAAMTRKVIPGRLRISLRLNRKSWIREYILE